MPKIFAFFVLFFVFRVPLLAQSWDAITFGDTESEKTHNFRTTETASECGISSENERPYRVLSAPKEENWRGETVRFSLKIRPDGDNYLTFQFWGSDASPNILVLSVDGQPLGYRHLGDYDLLHHGGAAPCPGKFYFVTTVLPRSLTDGKSVLNLELRMDGRIWSYGENFEQFQKNIDGNSIGIYSAHTHAQPCFEPSAALLGSSPKIATKTCPRPSPGPEVLERVKERVNRELSNLLTRPKILTQQEIEFLARGYVTPGTPVFRDPAVLSRVVEAVDEYCRNAQENPDLLFKDPRQYNPDWFGVAPLSEAIRHVNSPDLQSALNQPLPGASQTRREAWATMISESLTNLTRHRRSYTNQTMIIDWNIYRMNRALKIVSESQALPESQALRYLYESVGLEPWLGSETETGPAMPEGAEFYEITNQGLTRELGYVGSYGEALDWAALIYLATCERSADGKWLPGDEKIRQQLAKMERARSFFRYPAPDDDGYPALRLETVVGWRDTALVGPVMYGSRTGKEGDSTLLPFAVRSPESLARFDRMLTDNQYFCAVDALLRDGGGLRVSNILLGIPERYEYLTENRNVESAPLPTFPMDANAPDFDFADNEAGVVARKRGDEILYVSLYWRAHFGINFLSKVHRITPNFEQMATVRNQTIFRQQPGNPVYTRPNWTTFGFRPDWGVHYPERFDSLHRGEELPIARIPDSVRVFKPGNSSFYAGRGDVYTLHFGSHEIHLEMSRTHLTSTPTNTCEEKECILE